MQILKSQRARSCIYLPAVKAVKSVVERGLLGMYQVSVERNVSSLCREELSFVCSTGVLS